MTGLVGFVASIDRARGQLNTPDHARPVNQFVLAARGGANGQHCTERLRASMGAIGVRFQLIYVACQLGLGKLNPAQI